MPKYSYNYRLRAIAFFVLISFTLLNVFNQTFSYAQVAPQAPKDFLNFNPVETAKFLTIPDSLGTIQERFVPDVIPAEAGIHKSMDSHFRGNDKKSDCLIIYLQNAHANLDSERNTQNLIAHFQKAFNLPLVLLEGGEGKLDSLFFKSFPDKELKEKLLNDYLKKGDLSGGETAAILLDQHDTHYYGIENQALYEKNKNAFLEAIKNEPEISSRLDTIQKSLDQKAKSVLDADTLKFRDTKKSFEQEAIGLIQYAKALKALYESQLRRKLSFPHASAKQLPLGVSGNLQVEQGTFKTFEQSYLELAKILAAEQNERSSSKEDVNAATTKMVKLFQKNALPKLPKSKQMEVNQMIQMHQIGHLSQGMLIQHLEKVAKEINFFFQTPEVLKPSVYHARTLSSIQGTVIFSELKKLEADLRNDLPATEEGKQILKDEYHLELLRQFSKLEILPEDWEFIKNQQPSELLHSASPSLRGSNPSNAEAISEHGIASPDRPFGTGGTSGRPPLGQPASALQPPRNDVVMFNSLFAPHFHFYQLAQERDQVLLSNISAVIKKEKAKVALVATGGFHAAEITQQLKQSKTPFVLISPKINQFTDRSVYLNAMEGKRSFMKYFSGSLWDALAQDYAAKLAASLKPDELTPDLKRWRDRIIQNSIAEGRITEAGSYTKYVDALVQVLRKEYERTSPFGEKRGQAYFPMDQLPVPFSSQDREAQIREALKKELNSFLGTYFDKVESLLKGKIQVFGDGLKDLWKTGDVTPQSIGNLIDRISAVKSSNLAVSLALIREVRTEISQEPVIGDILKEFQPQGVNQVMGLVEKLFSEDSQRANAILNQVLAASEILDPEALQLASLFNSLLPEQKENIRIRIQELRNAQIQIPTIGRFTRADRRETVPRREPVKVPEEVPERKEPAPAPAPAKEPEPKPVPTPAEPNKEPVPAGERRAEARSTASGGEEWKELSYHLKRLKTGDQNAKMLAAEAIMDGLLQRQDYFLSDEDLDAIDQSFTDSQNVPTLHAQIFLTYIYGGFHLEKVRGVFVQEMSNRSKNNQLILHNGLSALNLIIRRGRASSFKKEILQMNLIDLLFPILNLDDSSLLLDVLNLFELLLGYVPEEEFLQNQRLKHFENLMTQSPYNDVRRTAASLLFILGKEVTPEFQAYFTKSPMGQIHELFDEVQKRPLKQVLSSEEQQNLYAQIQQSSLPKEFLRHLLVKEGKRIIFVGFDRLLQDAIKLGIVNDIVFLTEEAGLTHLALPFPPSQKTAFEDFLNGEEPESFLNLLAEHFGMDDMMEDKDAAEDFKSSKENFRELMNRLRGKIEFLFYGNEPGVSGENALDTQVYNLESIYKNKRSTKILVYQEFGPPWVVSKEDLISITGGVYFSVASALTQRLGKEKIAVLVEQDKESIDETSFMRLHNLKEFFDQHPVPTSFALETQDSVIASLRFAHDYTQSYAQIADAWIFRKEGGEENPDFFEQPSLPEPEVLMPSNGPSAPVIAGSPRSEARRAVERTDRTLGPSQSARAEARTQIEKIESVALRELSIEVSRLAHSLPNKQDRQFLLRQLADDLTKEPIGVWVARQEKLPIGFRIVRSLENLSLRDDLSAVIEANGGIVEGSFMVLRDSQKKGIGIQMLEESFAWLQRNSPGVRFYLSRIAPSNIDSLNSTLSAAREMNLKIYLAPRLGEYFVDLHPEKGEPEDMTKIPLNRIDSSPPESFLRRAEARVERQIPLPNIAAQLKGFHILPGKKSSSMQVLVADGVDYILKVPMKPTANLETKLNETVLKYGGGLFAPTRFIKNLKYVRNGKVVTTDVLIQKKVRNFLDVLDSFKEANQPDRIKNLLDQYLTYHEELWNRGLYDFDLFIYDIGVDSDGSVKGYDTDTLRLHPLGETELKRLNDNIAENYRKAHDYQQAGAADQEEMDRYIQQNFLYSSMDDYFSKIGTALEEVIDSDLTYLSLSAEGVNIQNEIGKQESVIAYYERMARSRLSLTSLKARLPQTSEEREQKNQPLRSNDLDENTFRQKFTPPETISEGALQDFGVVPTGRFGRFYVGFVQAEGPSPYAIKVLRSDENAERMFDVVKLIQEKAKELFVDTVLLPDLTLANREGKLLHLKNVIGQEKVDEYFWPYFAALVKSGKIQEAKELLNGFVELVQGLWSRGLFDMDSSLFDLGVKNQQVVAYDFSDLRAISQDTDMEQVYQAITANYQAAPAYIRPWLAPEVNNETIGELETYFGKLVDEKLSFDQFLKIRSRIDSSPHPMFTDEPSKAKLAANIVSAFSRAEVRGNKQTSFENNQLIEIIRTAHGILERFRRQHLSRGQAPSPAQIIQLVELLIKHLRYPLEGYQELGLWDPSKVSDPDKKKFVELTAQLILRVAMTPGGRGALIDLSTQEALSKLLSMDLAKILSARSEVRAGIALDKDKLKDIESQILDEIRSAAHQWQRGPSEERIAQYEKYVFGEARRFGISITKGHAGYLHAVKDWSSDYAGQLIDIFSFIRNGEILKFFQSFLMLVVSTILIIFQSQTSFLQTTSFREHDQLITEVRYAPMGKIYLSGFLSSIGFASWLALNGYIQSAVAFAVSPFWILGMTKLIKAEGHELTHLYQDIVLERIRQELQVPFSLQGVIDNFALEVPVALIIDRPPRQYILEDVIRSLFEELHKINSVRAEVRTNAPREMSAKEQLDQIARESELIRRVRIQGKQYLYPGYLADIERMLTWVKDETLLKKLEIKVLPWWSLTALYYVLISSHPEYGHANSGEVVVINLPIRIHFNKLFLHELTHFITENNPNILTKLAQGIFDDQGYPKPNVKLPTSNAGRNEEEYSSDLAVFAALHSQNPDQKVGKFRYLDIVSPEREQILLNDIFQVGDPKRFHFDASIRRQVTFGEMLTAMGWSWLGLFSLLTGHFALYILFSAIFATIAAPFYILKEISSEKAVVEFILNEPRPFNGLLAIFQILNPLSWRKNIASPVEIKTDIGKRVSDRSKSRSKLKKAVFEVALTLVAVFGFLFLTYWLSSLFYHSVLEPKVEMVSSELTDLLDSVSDSIPQEPIEIIASFSSENGQEDKLEEIDAAFRFGWSREKKDFDIRYFTTTIPIRPDQKDDLAGLSGVKLEIESSGDGRIVVDPMFVPKGEGIYNSRIDTDLGLEGVVFAVRKGRQQIFIPLERIGKKGYERTATSSPRRDPISSYNRLYGFEINFGRYVERFSIKGARRQIKINEEPVTIQVKKVILVSKSPRSEVRNIAMETFPSLAGELGLSTSPEAAVDVLARMPDVNLGSSRLDLIEALQKRIDRRLLEPNDLFNFVQLLIDEPNREALLADPSAKLDIPEQIQEGGDWLPQNYEERETTLDRINENTAFVIRKIQEVIQALNFPFPIILVGSQTGNAPSSERDIDILTSKLAEIGNSSQFSLFNQLLGLNLLGLYGYLDHSALWGMTVLAHSIAKHRRAFRITGDKIYEITAKAPAPIPAAPRAEVRTQEMEKLNRHLEELKKLGEKIKGFKGIAEGLEKISEEIRARNVDIYADFYKMNPAWESEMTRPEIAIQSVKWGLILFDLFYLVLGLKNPSQSETFQKAKENILGLLKTEISRVFNALRSATRVQSKFRVVYIPSESGEIPPPPLEVVLASMDALTQLSKRNFNGLLYFLTDQNNWSEEELYDLETLLHWILYEDVSLAKRFTETENPEVVSATQIRSAILKVLGETTQIFEHPLFIKFLKISDSKQIIEDIANFAKAWQAIQLTPAEQPYADVITGRLSKVLPFAHAEEDLSTDAKDWNKLSYKGIVIYSTIPKDDGHLNEYIERKKTLLGERDTQVLIAISNDADNRAGPFMERIQHLVTELKGEDLTRKTSDQIIQELIEKGILSPRPEVRSEARSSEEISFYVHSKDLGIKNPEKERVLRKKHFEGPLWIEAGHFAYRIEAFPEKLEFTMQRYSQDRATALGGIYRVPFGHDYFVGAGLTYIPGQYTLKPNQDDRLSRKHFRLQVSLAMWQPVFTLEDVGSKGQGSTNGTKVEWQDPDLIKQIGHSLFFPAALRHLRNKLNRIGIQSLMLAQDGIFPGYYAEGFYSLEGSLPAKALSILREKFDGKYDDKDFLMDRNLNAVIATQLKIKGESGPVVYHPGIGTRVSNDAKGLALLRTLIQTDFETLVATDSQKFSFEDFQSAVRDQLAGLVKNLHFEKKGAAYHVDFDFNGTHREVIAYYNFDASLKIPGEIQNGYHVLINRRGAYSPTSFVGTFWNSLSKPLALDRALQHLNPETGFVIAEGQDHSFQTKDDEPGLVGLDSMQTLKRLPTLQNSFVYVMGDEYLRLANEKNITLSDFKTRNFPILLLKQTEDSANASLTKMHRNALTKDISLQHEAFYAGMRQITRDFKGHWVRGPGLFEAIHILKSGKLKHGENSVYPSFRGENDQHWDKESPGLFILEPDAAFDHEDSRMYSISLKDSKVAAFVFAKQYVPYLRQTFPQYAAKIMSYEEAVIYLTSRAEVRKNFEDLSSHEKGKYFEEGILKILEVFKRLDHRDQAVAEEAIRKLAGYSQNTRHPFFDLLRDPSVYLAYPDSDITRNIAAPRPDMMAVRILSNHAVELIPIDIKLSPKAIKQNQLRWNSSVKGKNLNLEKVFELGTRLIDFESRDVMPETRARQVGVENFLRSVLEEAVHRAGNKSLEIVPQDGFIIAAARKGTSGNGLYLNPDVPKRIYDEYVQHTLGISDSSSRAEVRSTVPLKKWYEKQVYSTIPVLKVSQGLQSINKNLDDINTRIRNLRGEEINEEILIKKGSLTNEISQNYLKATEKFNKFIIDGTRDRQGLEQDYLEFHRVLGSGNIQTAGQYSVSSDLNSLDDIFKEIFSTSFAALVEEDPIRAAAHIFVALVNLQPFSDGNKRAASFILNYILMKAALPPFILDRENAAMYTYIMNTFREDENTISESEFVGFLKKVLTRAEAVRLGSAEPRSGRSPERGRRAELRSESSEAKLLAVLRAELGNPSEIVRTQYFDSIKPYQVLVSFDQEGKNTGIAFGKEGETEVHSYEVMDGGTRVEVNSHEEGVQVVTFSGNADDSFVDGWILGKVNDQYGLTVIYENGKRPSAKIFIQFDDWAAARAEARDDAELVLKSYDLGKDVKVESIVDRKGYGELEHVFLVQSEKGKYFLKKPWYRNKKELIDWEASLLSTLKSRGIPVASVIKNLNGENATVINGQLFVLYEFVEGEDLDVAEGDQLKTAGRLLAAIHNATENVTFSGRPYSVDELPPFIGVTSFEPKLKRLEEIEAEISQRGPPYTQVEQFFRNRFPQLQDHIQKIRSRLTPEILAKLPKVNAVHGDYHQWNVKFKGSQIVGIFDFEYAHPDARIYDFANVFVLRNGPAFDKLLQFLVAYEKLATRPLTNEELVLLPEVFRLWHLEGILLQLEKYRSDAESVKLLNQILQEFQILDSLDWKGLARQIIEHRAEVRTDTNEARMGINHFDHFNRMLPGREQYFLMNEGWYATGFMRSVLHHRLNELLTDKDGNVGGSVEVQDLPDGRFRIVVSNQSQRVQLEGNQRQLIGAGVNQFLGALYRILIPNVRWEETVNKIKKNSKQAGFKIMTAMWTAGAAVVITEQFANPQGPLARNGQIGALIWLVAYILFSYWMIKGILWAVIGVGYAIVSHFVRSLDTVAKRQALGLIDRFINEHEHQTDIVIANEEPGPENFYELSESLEKSPVDRGWQEGGVRYQALEKLVGGRAHILMEEPPGAGRQLSVSTSGRQNRLVAQEHMSLGFGENVIQLLQVVNSLLLPNSEKLLNARHKILKPMIILGIPVLIEFFLMDLPVPKNFRNIVDVFIKIAGPIAFVFAPIALFVIQIHHFIVNLKWVRARKILKRIHQLIDQYEQRIGQEGKGPGSTSRAEVRNKLVYNRLPKVSRGFWYAANSDEIPIFIADAIDRIAGSQSGVLFIIKDQPVNGKPFVIASAPLPITHWAIAKSLNEALREKQGEKYVIQSGHRALKIIYGGREKVLRAGIYGDYIKDKNKERIKREILQAVLWFSNSLRRLGYTEAEIKNIQINTLDQIFQDNHQIQFSMDQLLTWAAESSADSARAEARKSEPEINQETARQDASIVGQIIGDRLLRNLGLVQNPEAAEDSIKFNTALQKLKESRIDAEEAQKLIAPFIEEQVNEVLKLQRDQMISQIDVISGRFIDGIVIQNPSSIAIDDVKETFEQTIAGMIIDSRSAKIRRDSSGRIPPLSGELIRSGMTPEFDQFALEVMNLIQGLVPETNAQGGIALVDQNKIDGLKPVINNLGVIHEDQTVVINVVEQIKREAPNLDDQAFASYFNQNYTRIVSTVLINFLRLNPRFKVHVVAPKGVAQSLRIGFDRTRVKGDGIRPDQLFFGSTPFLGNANAVLSDQLGTTTTDRWLQSDTDRKGQKIKLTPEILRNLIGGTFALLNEQTVDGISRVEGNHYQVDDLDLLAMLVNLAAIEAQAQTRLTQAA